MSLINTSKATHNKRPLRPLKGVAGRAKSALPKAERYGEVHLIKDRKSIMKLLRMIPLVLLISGCNDDSSSSNEISIWDESSQRILIVQDNSNVPNTENRFITHDFSLDTLSPEAKDILPQIKTKNTELSCVNDGVTYEVTITDSSGLETEYLSSNRACNNVNAIFLDTSDLDNLISVL